MPNKQPPLVDFSIFSNPPNLIRNPVLLILGIFSTIKGKVPYFAIKAWFLPIFALFWGFQKLCTRLLTPKSSPWNLELHQKKVKFFIEKLFLKTDITPRKRPLNLQISPENCSKFRRKSALKNLDYSQKSALKTSDFSRKLK